MTFFLEGSQEVVWDAELPVPDPSFAPLVAHLRKLSKKFDAKAVKENLKPTNELLNLIDGLGKSANAGNSNDDTLGSGGSTPQNGRPKQGAGRLGSPTSPGGGNTSTKGLGWAALGASGGLSTRLKKKDQRVSSVARLPFNPKLALESSMWGINARSVAVESMLFLSDVMWFLHPRLQCFMQPAEAHGDGFVNIGCTDAAASKRMRDFYEVSECRCTSVALAMNQLRLTHACFGCDLSDVPLFDFAVPRIFLPQHGADDVYGWT